jgi:hypothetical protein
MDCRYQYEHFSSGNGEFDRKFTDYLNRKRSENWCVQSCAYHRDAESDTLHADCIFSGGPAAGQSTIS